VALPTLNRRINASTADLQWIVTIYSSLFAGLLLVAGHLGDRMGHKRILQIGLVLFALTSLAAARSGVSGLAVGLGPLAGGLLLGHYWWGLDLHGEHPRGGRGPDRGIQSGARIS
jgi:sugar phosphate permease